MIEIKGKAVLRDGDKIGSIDGDSCILTTEVGPSIKGAIRKAAGNAELTFGASTKPQADEQEPTVKLTDEMLLAELKRRGLGIPTTTPAVEMRPASPSSSAIADMIAAAERGEIPHPPPQHPAMGHKDPAFVAWVRDHATPDEFSRIYDGRKVPASMQEFEAGASASTRRLDRLEKTPIKI